MTPELKKEIIVGIAGVIFTGIPTVFLVWWTWARDREHLLVQKIFWNMKLEDSDDERNEVNGILVRNQSLFPVRISYAALRIDGVLIKLKSPLLRANTKRDQDPESHSDDYDPWELPSRAAGTVLISADERQEYAYALNDGMKRNGISVIEEFLTGPLVVAIVKTETRGEFSSMSLAEKMKSAFDKTRRFSVVAIIIVALFAWLVWPTLYSYRNYKPDDTTYLLRFHRISGSVEKLTGSGWEPMKPFLAPVSGGSIKTVPLDQSRPANPPVIDDINRYLVPKPEYIHPCPKAQLNPDVPPPPGYATSQCVSMLAPNRKVIAEIQVENERQAREIGFELVLIKPKN